MATKKLYTLLLASNAPTFKNMNFSLSMKYFFYIWGR